MFYFSVFILLLLASPFIFLVAAQIRDVIKERKELKN